jgi:hypothetical protein
MDRSSTGGRAVVDRVPVHIHDLRAVGDDMAISRGVAERTGIRTTLGIPLLRDGKAIGALLLRRTEVRPFTDEQIALVQTFADQAVIAIENARLLDELHTRQRELEAKTSDLAISLEYQTAFFDVLDIISRFPNDLQPVLDKIVSVASKLCDSADCMIFFEVAGQLHRQAHVGTARAGSLTVPINRDSTIGRASVDHCPVHVEDLLAMKEEMPEGYRYAL